MPTTEQQDRGFNILTQAQLYCKKFRHQFFMPEHILYAITDDDNFTDALFSYTDDEILVQITKGVN